jgi:hypothetical protein
MFSTPFAARVARPLETMKRTFLWILAAASGAEYNVPPVATAWGQRASHRGRRESTVRTGGTRCSSASLTGTARTARPSSSARTQHSPCPPSKEATHWTLLSCHRFRANEVRLLLGVIAYNLGNLLRRLVLPVAIRRWSVTSLQQRLFKTGERLIRHAGYFVLRLAESHLTGTLFRQILGRIERLAWHLT